MPIDKSAPLGLGAFFGQLNAEAIVANEGTPKGWRRAFRRRGMRLGDSVDSRAGINEKIRLPPCGITTHYYTAAIPF
ncbi:hypothetical protein CSAL01_00495 [Colletotrichum salicis]|uniref:Uncharacterized protein n=1 Tax=Colletotrichum salicis TaxID=1209931 RepID=A0A135SCX4_9PEZI|nr:hypothetical protein CSAL01_00495 [Colletotrichum salicis]